MARKRKAPCDPSKPTLKSPSNDYVEENMKRRRKIKALEPEDIDISSDDEPDGSDDCDRSRACDTPFGYRDSLFRE